MIQLSREIRFALLPPEIPFSPQRSNSWSGWPSTNLVVPQLKLSAVIEGQPDAVTGYVCNITVLDSLLRDVVTQSLIPNFGGQAICAETIIRHVWQHTNETWPLKDRLIRIELTLSPFLKFSIDTDAPTMVCLTQQFEFSAAHRLHCDSLSDQENRELFGKCNNPEGHGHNYVVEISVEGAGDPKSNSESSVVNLDQFQATVKSEIIDRLDHKHLNRDVPYFAEVNPSVENMAIAIYNWLDGKVDATLSSVKLYETPKTWAEYRGKAKS